MAGVDCSSDRREAYIVMGEKFTEMMDKYNLE